MKYNKTNQKSERGGAGVKLIITLVILFLIAHAGYNYIPVAYEGENLKQEMQTAVVQGLATPMGMTPALMVKGKLQKAAVENNLPSDALIEIKQVNNVMQAHVRYSKPINMLPFGIFKYNYNFDHTATPNGFLLKE